MYCLVLSSFSPPPVRSLLLPFTQPALSRGIPHVSLVFLVKGAFPCPCFLFVIQTLELHATPRDSIDCNDGDINEV